MVRIIYLFNEFLCLPIAVNDSTSLLQICNDSILSLRGPLTVAFVNTFKIKHLLIDFNSSDLFN